MAERLGINRGTLYKWQDSLPFRCFYNKQCSDYKSEVKNALLGLHNEAVATVRELLQTGGEATRLKAAIWLLEKVEAVGVGATDVREVLQERATKTGWNDDNWVTFDKKAYQQSLKDFGLSDE